MQVRRRTVIAAAAVSLGLATTLVVVGARYRRLSAAHADLAADRLALCRSRYWELRSLLPPVRPSDSRDRNLAVHALVDPQTSQLCVGAAYPIDTDTADWCWITTKDRGGAGRCYDRAFEGLWLVYRFWFDPEL